MILLSIIVGGLSLGMSWFLVKFTLEQLRKNAILDHPNDRSSHAIPTPRGGGWGIVLTLLAIWSVILSLFGTPGHWPLMMLGAVLLVVVSWLDDLRDVAPRWRLLAQITAVFLGLYALPDGFSLTNGFLPFWLERGAMAVAWLWFINLYNFMDGIDGITGTETASIGVGLILISLTSAIWLNFPALPALSISLIGAAIGFLRWNWHPAKVFMGDVGSVTLGYLIAWLLFQTAGAGGFWAALILPLYYCLDASITLTKRLLCRQPIWQAHRQHAYQKAVDGGMCHDRVVIRILIGNLGLIICAIGTGFFGVVAVIPAFMIMAGLFWALRPR
jgi:UDP-N-acetylmuramyl pentapeptide phosphotransferase/UDP-N-acetylglucosamine-1-phosphate transferase